MADVLYLRFDLSDPDIDDVPRLVDRPPPDFIGSLLISTQLIGLLGVRLVEQLDPGLPRSFGRVGVPLGDRSDGLDPDVLAASSRRRIEYDGSFVARHISYRNPLEQWLTPLVGTGGALGGIAFLANFLATFKTRHRLSAVQAVDEEDKVRLRMELRDEIRKELRRNRVTRARDPEAAVEEAINGDDLERLVRLANFLSDGVMVPEAEAPR